MTNAEIEKKITEKLKEHRECFRNGDIIWALNLAIKTVKECFDEVEKDETMA